MGCWSNGTGHPVPCGVLLFLKEFGEMGFKERLNLFWYELRVLDEGVRERGGEGVGMRNSKREKA